MKARVDERTRMQRVVPALVMLGVVAPIILRSRYEFAANWPQYTYVIEQLLLVMTLALMAAAVAFGAKAWLDVRGGR